MLEIAIMHLRELQQFLLKDASVNVFQKYGKEKIYILEREWKNICYNDYTELNRLQELIVQTIEELIKHSKQRFFHHDINTKKSNKVTEGCWITRGNPTKSKMWTSEYNPQLIICDEAQRLGLIGELRDEDGTLIRDSFDEIEQILSHSKKTFFTGDNFQMLNVEYDKGIEEIEQTLASKEERLIRFDLPETVGVPTEIGMLMKYFVHQNVNVSELVQLWQNNHDFEIIFIKQNRDKLVEMFDEDKSSKKHFASPLDKQWGGSTCFTVAKRENKNWKNEIKSLNTHEKEFFAYRYPYFCNEEIMPNYVLSAYELISRELESLYVYIPKFEQQPTNNIWYKNHLYVLFTRATRRLVVNFEDENEFNHMLKLYSNLEKQCEIKVTILGK